MKEIREIFETVRTYCGMMFGENSAAKSVMENTESILAPMAGEDAIVHERLVSVTSAGAGENQNEIIQSSPSPEFLNSLPFIKKFYPAPRWGEGKVTEVAHDNNSNSSETDHASMPLGIFTSKNLAAWLPSCLAAKRAAFTLAEGATHVAHCDKFRRAAFTLAEVLITLGIIGVVAALTLPTLIQNHQKQVYVTQLKKAYSTLNNAINKMAVDEGVVDWSQTFCGSTQFWGDNDINVSFAKQNECYDRILKQFNVMKKKQVGVVCSEPWCMYGYVDVGNTHSNIDDLSDFMFVTSDGMTYLFLCGGGFSDIGVDVNGIAKGPNKVGRDYFEFHWKNHYESNLIPDGSEYDSWKNCSATNLSTSCTAKVLIEGKMNY